MDKHLHIVTLDVPWPADYGGAIDQLFKIIWLHNLGVKIHLHCFTKKRPPAPALEQYCESVQYYPRVTGWRGFSWKLPYIVSSRKSPALLTALQQDDYPILLEGVHCSYHLFKDAFKNRQVFVRLHNAEFNYYRQLAQHEHHPFKKLYYSFESRQLLKYEKAIATKATLLSISKTDAAIFEKDFGAKQVKFLPAFVGWEKVTGQAGRGCYCLYHGNLSINENEEAAIWLLKEVFNDLQLPFVIAGKAPSQRLQELAHQQEHTCIVANPAEKELQDMIAKAQVHILPSLNNTGIKLKLLNALYCGRHCLVNDAGVAGSDLDSLCNLAEKPADFKNMIRQLYEKPFTETTIQQRSLLLQKLNSNQRNAQKLIQIIWGD